MEQNNKNPNPDGFMPFDSDEIYENPQENERIIDVRGESELAKQKKLKKKGQKAIVFLLGSFFVIVASAMAYYLYAKNKSTEDVVSVESVEFAKPEERDFGQAFMKDEIGEYDPYAAAKEDVEEDNLLSPVEPTDGIKGSSSPEPNFDIQQPAPIEPQIQTENPVYLPAPAPELTPEEVKEKRIYKDSFSLGSSNGALSGGTDTKSNNSSNSSSPLSKSLQSSKVEGTTASKIGNRDLILTKGSMIDCVLNTKFNSSVVGMMTCTTTRNIYSASGRVILIDRGSKIVGEYQGGIQHGQSRVFVLWKRIETPKGVMIDIDSPAAGSLGQSGVTGRLDTKFWTRFGGAMMVSLIEDASSSFTRGASEKVFGVDIDVEDTSQTGKEFSQEYINQLVNIKPSLVKHQGDRLNVFVARDVFFDDVYELQAVR